MIDKENGVKTGILTNTTSANDSIELYKETGTNYFNHPINTNTPLTKDSNSTKKITSSQNNNPYLSSETIQKILNELLTQKNISKESIAKTLSVTLSELETILSNNQLPLELISKINLPLVMLYCEIKI